MYMHYCVYKIYSRQAENTYDAWTTSLCEKEDMDACSVSVCVCARKPETEMRVCLGPDSLLPSEGGLDLSAACAETEPALLFSSPLHTPAIRQPAKQTDEVNRETFPCVFWDVTATDATLTPTLDTVWQPTVSTQPAPLWLILREEGREWGMTLCTWSHTR